MTMHGVFDGVMRIVFVFKNQTSMKNLKMLLVYDIDLHGLVTSVGCV